MKSIGFLSGLIAAASLLPVVSTAQTVQFEVSTSRSGDTLYEHEPSSIHVWFDPAGNGVAAVTVPLEFRFTNGNIVGASPDEATVDRLKPVFDPIPNPPDELSGGAPDTLLYGLLDFDLLGDTTVELIRMSFQPKDTGQILLDSILVPPANHLAALDQNAEDLPLTWSTSAITVLPCPVLMGDYTDDGVVNSADIIGTVRCIFQCGGFNDQLIIADVNCSGTTTTADVILLVNYLFRGMDLPDCCMVP